MVLDLKELGVTREEFDEMKFDVCVGDHVKSFNEDAVRNGSKQRASWDADSGCLRVKDGDGEVVKSLKPFVNPDIRDEKKDPYLLFETV